MRKLTLDGRRRQHREEKRPPIPPPGKSLPRENPRQGPPPMRIHQRTRKTADLAHRVLDLWKLCPNKVAQSKDNVFPEKATSGKRQYISTAPLGLEPGLFCACLRCDCRGRCRPLVKKPKFYNTVHRNPNPVRTVPKKKREPLEG